MQPETSSPNHAHYRLSLQIRDLSDAEFERAVRGHLVEFFGPFQANGPTPSDAIRAELLNRARLELREALEAVTLRRLFRNNPTARNRQRTIEARTRLQRARRNYNHAFGQRSKFYRTIWSWIEKMSAH